MLISEQTFLCSHKFNAPLNLPPINEPTSIHDHNQTLPILKVKDANQEEYNTVTLNISTADTVSDDDTHTSAELI